VFCAHYTISTGTALLCKAARIASEAVSYSRQPASAVLLRQFLNLNTCCYTI
jgi:hypothetical protein